MLSLYQNCLTFPAFSQPTLDPSELTPHCRGLGLNVNPSGKFSLTTLCITSPPLIIFTVLSLFFVSLMKIMIIYTYLLKKIYVPELPYHSLYFKYHEVNHVSLALLSLCARTAEPPVLALSLQSWHSSWHIINSC